MATEFGIPAQGCHTSLGKQGCFHDEHQTCAEVVREPHGVVADVHGGVGGDSDVEALVESPRDMMQKESGCDEGRFSCKWGTSRGWTATNTNSQMLCMQSAQLGDCIGTTSSP